MVAVCADCRRQITIMAKGWCARCYMKHYNRQRRATDPIYRAKSNAYSRAYMRRLSKAEVAERSRLYRQRHPERARAGWDRWEGRNPEKAKQSDAASARRRRAKDPEKFRASTRVWFAKNKPYRVMKENERRARKHGAGGRVSVQEWEDIKRRQRQRCAYCRKRRPLTQDHVEPLSKGGRHVAANIVGACRPCNSRKKDRIVAVPNWPF
jgi:5-methylcytosine-specific restriction endonuclease McrA